MDIATLQAYGFFFFTAFLVAVLYGYIYHIYSSKKKGGRDYEKYGNLALNDNINDPLVEDKLMISKKEEA